MIAEGIATVDEIEMLSQYEAWKSKTLAVKLSNSEIADLKRNRTNFLGK